MNSYLFIFSFETPAMVKANLEWESDFEDSLSVFIQAATEKEAFDWGRMMANDFFTKLFVDKVTKLCVDGYTHWVEANPENVFGAKALKNIPVVIAGEKQSSGEIVSGWISRA